MNPIDWVVRRRLAKTDHIFVQMEKELAELTAANKQLRAAYDEKADSARRFESLSQHTFKFLLGGEAEALACIDETTGDERLKWEGERRAFRKAQVGMQITGRTLGIGVRDGN